MNTPTIIVTLLTLWLVMGLGFWAEYANARREGKTLFQALVSYEGLLFILSIAIPIIIMIHRATSG